MSTRTTLFLINGALQGVSTSDEILSGGVVVQERGSDPTPQADRVIFYSKEVLGRSEVFFRASDGTISQVTTAEGNISGWTDEGGTVRLTNLSNVAAIGDGSAGSPSLTFYNETGLDIGLFRAAADNLGIVASDRVRYYQPTSTTQHVDISKDLTIFAGGCIFFHPGSSAGLETNGIGRTALNRLGFVTDSLKRMELRNDRLTVSSSQVGADMLSVVQNEDNTSGASNAVFLAIVGGTLGGDPVLRLEVPGATVWSVGVDNSDSDMFKIGPSTTVGSSSALVIETSGAMQTGVVSTPLPAGVTWRHRHNNPEFVLQRVLDTQDIPLRFSNATFSTSTGAELRYLSSSNELRMWNFESSHLLFGTSDTERARITSAGEVLIGTSTLSGTELVNIRHDFGGDTFVNAHNNDSTGRAGFNAQADSAVAFLFATGTSYTPTNGLVATEGGVTAGNQLAFGTSSVNHVRFFTNATERSRILSSGEFLVGATALLSAELAQFRRDDNSSTQVRVYNNTNGTAAEAAFIAQNASHALTMGVTDTAYTAVALIADAGFINTSTAPNGFVIYTGNATSLRFGTNTVERYNIQSDGRLEMAANYSIVPNTDDSGTIGTDNTETGGDPLTIGNRRWHLIRGNIVKSGDYRFENGWTLTEDYSGAGGIKLLRPDGSVAEQWS